MASNVILGRLGELDDDAVASSTPAPVLLYGPLARQLEPSAKGLGMTVPGRGPEALPSNARGGRVTITGEEATKFSASLASLPPAATVVVTAVAFVAVEVVFLWICERRRGAGQVTFPFSMSSDGPRRRRQSLLILRPG